MPWGSRALTLYHGTAGCHADDIDQNGIKLARCSPIADFGRGFYTTRIFAQAVAFANERYRMMRRDHARDPANHPQNPNHAAVVEFDVVLGALGSVETLAFVQPTDDWLEFVKYCRQPAAFHKRPDKFYEAVYGPMLASAQDTAYAGWEQLSLHSDYAVSLLNPRHVHRGNSGSPEL